MLFDEGAGSQIPWVSQKGNEFSFILGLFISITLGLNHFLGHLRIFVFYEMVLVIGLWKYNTLIWGFQQVACLYIEYS